MFLLHILLALLNFGVAFSSKTTSALQIFTKRILAYLQLKYCKVASSNTSRLEEHDGSSRLVMKGIFDPHVVWHFGKKLVSN